MAKAIHHLSKRKDKPFIAINCGALPDNLLESELFGYKSGAFTDAKKDKAGKFVLAQGGTIFLDEIGDTSPAFQVKLLRVLEEKQITPLGDTKSFSVDVRIIAATNKDLAEMIKQKSFRDDLYYRINVVKVKIPPLRERKEDIPLLIEHFIQHFNYLYKREISSISQNALTKLMTYDFPGNVRELENIIEYAFVLCTERTIKPEHLPDYLQNKEATYTKTDVLRSTVETIEAQTIMDVLARNNYNRKKAAQELGLHKSTLYRKIKRYNLKIPKKQ